MDVYKCTIGGETRYVRATEEDGQFRSDDVEHGVAARTPGYQYTFAGSIEALVAKGVKSYASRAAASGPKPDAFRALDAQARAERRAMGARFYAAR